MPADLYAEMIRILDGGSATLPRLTEGRVLSSDGRSRTGLEGVLVEILELTWDGDREASASDGGSDEA